MATQQAAVLAPAAGSLAEHISRTLRLAVPVMFSRAGILILTVVDSAMTGHAGAVELAYYALGMAPQLFITLIGIGSLLGTVVLVAQADGAERWRECGAIWRIALLHAFVYGIGLLVLSHAGEWFLLVVGQEADLARGGGVVAMIFGWSVPALLMYAATTMFLEGIGRPVPGMIIMLLANLLNAWCNWLLIFGHWGFPAMGAEGATMATLIARWFMFFAALFYVFTRVDSVRYGIKGAIAGFWQTGKRLRRIGYPMALSQGLESGAFTTVTLFAGLLGAVQVAAFQVTMSLIALVFMFALGFSIAASVRVGNAVGRQDVQGIRYAGWVAAGLAIIVLGFWGGLFASIPDLLTVFYTQETEVAVVAVAAITMGALVLVPDGLQAVLMGALRGVADVWPATILYLIAFWLVMVPLAYLLGVYWQGGAVGLVQGIALGCVVAAILLALRFHWVSVRAVAAT